LHIFPISDLFKHIERFSLSYKVNNCFSSTKTDRTHVTYIPFQKLQFWYTKTTSYVRVGITSTPWQIENNKQANTELKPKNLHNQNNEICKWIYHNSKTLMCICLQTSAYACALNPYVPCTNQLERDLDPNPSLNFFQLHSSYLCTNQHQ